ncbi:MAG: VIT family protein [Pseudomonadota bacterium]
MSEHTHYINRSAALRAAVLGANDGILSTASLIVGVAAAAMTRGDILLTGLAGLTAGALSMAAGEYVSVSAQSDIEHADLKRESKELRINPDGELRELAEALRARGVAPDVALRAAEQMTQYDALGAHAREELSLTDISEARPLQAAFASALSFALGAAVPLLAAGFAPSAYVLPAVAVATVVALAILGGTGAVLGGAPIRPAVTRVVLWGVLAMAATALLGRLMDGVVTT